MLAYFVLTNHVDLYPWNNLRESQWTSTLAGVVPFGIYAAAFTMRLRWLMLVGMVHAYVWLGLQIRQWWVPYLLGPTPLHGSFDWYFGGGYRETLKLLPPLGERPVPDLQHMVLQALSLLVVVAATAAVLAAWRSRRP
jgi:hypothetical protein